MTQNKYKFVYIKIYSQDIICIMGDVSQSFKNCDNLRDTKWHKIIIKTLTLKSTPKWQKIIVNLWKFKAMLKMIYNLISAPDLIGTKESRSFKVKGNIVTSIVTLPILTNKIRAKPIMCNCPAVLMACYRGIIWTLRHGNIFHIKLLGCKWGWSITLSLFLLRR